MFEAETEPAYLRGIDNINDICTRAREYAPAAPAIF